MPLGNWTTEAPTEAGWYWFQGQQAGGHYTYPIIVSAVHGRFYLPGDVARYLPADFSGLWTGPIYPPELPATTPGRARERAI